MPDKTPAARLTSALREAMLLLGENTSPDWRSALRHMAERDPECARHVRKVARMLLDEQARARACSPQRIPMPAEHWSDVMPELDLGTDGCVPFRCSGQRIVSRRGERYLPRQPDLDHPEGFAFALRWLCSIDVPSHVDRQALLRRWVLSETTDADRLTLAHACAEVAP